MSHVKQQLPEVATPEELQAERDRWLAEKEVSDSFRDLVSRICSRHGSKYDPECGVCRYVKAWALYVAWFEQKALEAHNELKGLKDIHLPETQDRFTRLSERENIFLTMVREPERLAAQKHRSWLARQLAKAQEAFENAVRRRTDQQSTNRK